MKTRLGSSLRRGLTLIELLLVLFILAITTSIAVRMTSSLEDQARFEATQRGIKEIDEAVVGAQGVRQPDGTILVQGFVADMGRLPIVRGTDPNTQLLELWRMPTDVSNNPLLPEFKLRSYTDNTDPTHPLSMKVACGWRPQLRLAPGANELLDGWADPYQLTTVTDNGIANSVTSVFSLGADNALGGSGNEMDLGLPRAWTSSVIQGDIDVVVQVLDGSGVPGNPSISNGDVRIVVLGPNPNATNDGNAIDPTKFQDIPIPASGASSTFPALGHFENVYIGPKTIYARQKLGASVTYFSDPAYVSVTPGGILTVKLILRPVTP